MILSALVAALAFFYQSGLAHAEDVNTGTARTPKQEVKDARDKAQAGQASLKAEAGKKRQEIKDAASANREELKAKAIEVKGAMKDELEAKAKDIRAKMEARTKELKDKMEARAEDFKKKLELRTEETKKKMEMGRAEFKKKLETVKDEKKKQIAERLDSQMAELNSRRVQNFTDTANRLNEILNKIVTHTDKVELAGGDVSSVRTSITAAQGATESARAAITTQAGKTYVVAITTEANLKNDVGAVRQKLETDLKTVRVALQSVRDAVKKAAQSLEFVAQETANPGTAATSPATTPPSGENANQ